MAVSIATPRIAPTFAPAPAPRRLALVVPSCIPDLNFAMWAPRERRCVFNACTIPEYIESWAHTPDSTATKATARLSPGTSFSIAAWRRDLEQYRVEGTLLAINEPCYIRAIWETRTAARSWNSTITLTFEDFDEGTLLRIVQSGIARSDHRDRQIQWWHQRLENLRKFLRITSAAI